MTTVAATPFATSASAIQISMLSKATVVEIYGYEVNMMAMSLIMLIIGILIMFYQIQKSNKLDFADMITKDGRSVSLTKILQLVGGATATWIMVKLTLTGGLTEALFGLYLTYVGAIEGYSKFVAAKYNYTEKSVKDAKE